MFGSDKMIKTLSINDGVIKALQATSSGNPHIGVPSSQLTATAGGDEAAGA